MKLYWKFYNTLLSVKKITLPINLANIDIKNFHDVCVDIFT